MDLSSDEKKPANARPSNGDVEKPISGSVGELDDLVVLGYTPELQRNRSMFTLLFQSLSIAAVRAIVTQASLRENMKEKRKREKKDH